MAYILQKTRQNPEGTNRYTKTLFKDNKEGEKGESRRNQRYKRSWGQGGPKRTIDGICQ
jgi:hypothetical protein